MRSKTTSIRIPSGLADKLAARADALGYASFSAYLVGLVRYDCLVQGPHDLTVPWSHLSLSRQDKIDDHLCRLLHDGVGERGQLLRRLLERANHDAAGMATALAELEPDISPKPKTPHP
jgi:hypothetical protein